MTADAQTYIAGLSAFAGALVGTGGLGWWLATRFNHVYARIALAEKLLTLKMDDHEKMDIERFGKQDLAIMRVELALQTRGKGLYEI